MTSKDNGVAASVARKKKNQKGNEKEVEEQEEVIGRYSGAGGQQYELRDPHIGSLRSNPSNQPKWPIRSGATQ